MFLCIKKENCLEDNSDYSLFSLFDLLLQSGKLVTKMFQKIQQLIDDKDALVFVLIDEVRFNKNPEVLKISVSRSVYVPTFAYGQELWIVT